MGAYVIHQSPVALMHVAFNHAPVTNSPVDLAALGMLLRESRRVGCHFQMRTFLMEARKDWRIYLSNSQRRWQRETRRPTRARHHDSISIREKYVRCHA